ncbi:peptide chain release factor N(5)-glutamine methyltransferase [Acidipropionibacterium timonense]|uniref:peptide chain release factor N(5)-glutamine methyltransferase n=1 Tax=Acidipropionibacterium timonense TaxID=2161818 RepID=UPI00103089FC|nr:peptide chain release factor N(5)-glutamine methyltransferase [Acidipropionibacterium timonense]
MTTSSTLARGVRRLSTCGVSSPAADARLLLCHVLGVSPNRLLLAPEPTDAQIDHYHELLDRRAGGEPAQYLVGEAWFRGLRLAVGPGVLVPRMETELVAGAAIEEAARRARQGDSPLVVDLCTGSGAIALAVATEVPASRVVAVELDPRALEWARRNLAGTGVEVIAGDALVEPQLVGVDVVVSNPPYLPTGAAARMPQDVLAHEPAVALFGGEDGLELIRPLVDHAADLLRPGGLLVLEHDEGHRAAIDELLGGAGWVDVVDHDDLTGRPRYVTARSPER